MHPRKKCVSLLARRLLLSDALTQIWPVNPILLASPMLLRYFFSFVRALTGDITRTTAFPFFFFFFSKRVSPKHSWRCPVPIARATVLGELVIVKLLEVLDLREQKSERTRKGSRKDVS